MISLLFLTVFAYPTPFLNDVVGIVNDVTKGKVDLNTEINTKIIPLAQQYAPPQFRKFIVDFIKKLEGLLKSTGGKLPISKFTQKKTSAYLPSSPPTSKIPPQYQSYWNKIPKDLQMKLQTAVQKGKLNLSDVSNIVKNKDYISGLSLLTSSGFSLQDGMRLKSAFEQ